METTTWSNQISRPSFIHLYNWKFLLPFHIVSTNKYLLKQMNYTRWRRVVSRFCFVSVFQSWQADLLDRDPWGSLPGPLLGPFLGSWPWQCEKPSPPASLQLFISKEFAVSWLLMRCWNFFIQYISQTKQVCFSQSIIKNWQFAFISITEV